MSGTGIGTLSLHLQGPAGDCLFRHDPRQTGLLRYLVQIVSSGEEEIPQNDLRGNLQAEERRERVLALRLEDICLKARATLERAFAHVCRRFLPEFVAIEDKRYAHTRGNSILARIPFEYRVGLTKPQIAMVEKDFEAFAPWFYD
jgi:hypothetical protein